MKLVVDSGTMKKRSENELWLSLLLQCRDCEHLTPTGKIARSSHLCETEENSQL